MRVLTDPCLGLDISKLTIDACLLIQARVLHAQFENSKSGLRRLRAWCQKSGAPLARVVLEATGRYSDLAATELHGAGHLVHLANPRRIKDYARSLGRRNKTDRLDAALIADFGASRTLPAWVPAAAEQAQLRALMRRHNELEKACHAERNRLEALADPLVAKSISRILAALQKELALLEKQITLHLKASPTLANEIERLCQIEGVGVRTARWLCAELPRHLLNARGAAAWLSVTPKVRQSGTSVYSTARAGADGNVRLRRALFMAALTARRHNPRLNSFADRLAAAGKSKLTVIIAVLHKLLKIAFCMLKNNTAYNPTHHPLSAA